MEEPESRTVSSILKWSVILKRVIAGILMAMMFLVVGVVTLQIVWAFISAMLPGHTLSTGLVMPEAQMIAILGLFLTVLIALELIETVEVYFRRNSIHVEIVVLVAIIALARKVILIDLEKYTPQVMAGLGFLVLALGSTYFLVKRAGAPDN